MAADCTDLTLETINTLEEEFEQNYAADIDKQKCLRYGTQCINKIHKEIAMLHIYKTFEKSSNQNVKQWFTLLLNFFNVYRKSDESMDLVFELMDWPFYDVFKSKMDKYIDLLNSGTNEPTLPEITWIQRETLFYELQCHSKEIMSVHIKKFQRQRIWENITKEMNFVESVKNLSVVETQKIWLNIKLKAQHRNQQSLLGTDPDDMRILNICGIKTVDEDKIKQALESFVEFGYETDHLECRTCNVLHNKHGPSRSCQSCIQSNVVICELCLIHPTAKVYSTNTWSSTAKELIPSLLNKDQIYICANCNKNLLEQASLKWKICRLCAKEAPIDILNSSSLTIFHWELNALFGHKIPFGNGLPDNICMCCLKEFQSIKKFHTSLKRVQTVLNRIHKNHFVGEGVDLNSDDKKNIKKPISKKLLNHTLTNSSSPYVVTDKNTNFRFIQPKDDALLKLPKDQFVDNEPIKFLSTSETSSSEIEMENVTHSNPDIQKDVLTTQETTYIKNISKKLCQNVLEQPTSTEIPLTDIESDLVTNIIGKSNPSYLFVDPSSKAFPAKIIIKSQSDLKKEESPKVDSTSQKQQNPKINFTIRKPASFFSSKRIQLLKIPSIKIKDLDVIKPKLPASNSTTQQIPQSSAIQKRIGDPTNKCEDIFNRLKREHVAWKPPTKIVIKKLVDLKEEVPKTKQNVQLSPAFKKHIFNRAKNITLLKKPPTETEVAPKINLNKQTSSHTYSYSTKDPLLTDPHDRTKSQSEGLVQPFDTTTSTKKLCGSVQIINPTELKNTMNYNIVSTKQKPSKQLETEDNSSSNSFFGEASNHSLLYYINQKNQTQKSISKIHFPNVRDEVQCPTKLFNQPNAKVSKNTSPLLEQSEKAFGKEFLDDIPSTEQQDAQNLFKMKVDLQKIINPFDDASMVAMQIKKEPLDTDILSESVENGKELYVTIESSTYKVEEMPDQRFAIDHAVERNNQSPDINSTTIENDVEHILEFPSNNGSQSSLKFKITNVASEPETNESVKALNAERIFIKNKEDKTTKEPETNEPAKALNARRKCVQNKEDESASDPETNISIKVLKEKRKFVRNEEDKTAIEPDTNKPIKASKAKGEIVINVKDKLANEPVTKKPVKTLKTKRKFAKNEEYETASEAEFNKTVKSLRSRSEIVKNERVTSTTGIEQETIKPTELLKAKRKCVINHEDKTASEAETKKPVKTLRAKRKCGKYEEDKTDFQPEIYKPAKDKYEDDKTGSETETSKPIKALRSKRKFVNYNEDKTDSDPEFDKPLKVKNEHDKTASETEYNKPVITLRVKHKIVKYEEEKTDTESEIDEPLKVKNEKDKTVSEAETKNFVKVLRSSRTLVKYEDDKTDSVPEIDKPVKVKNEHDKTPSETENNKPVKTLRAKQKIVIIEEDKTDIEINKPVKVKNEEDKTALETETNKQAKALKTKRQFVENEKDEAANRIKRNLRSGKSKQTTNLKQ